MVSKIERGEVQPSLDMAIRLADALGTRLSAMIRTDTRQRVMKIERASQATFRDPDGAWERRLLSPSFKASKIEVLGGSLAPGAKTGHPIVHEHDAEEYVVVIRGKLIAKLGDASITLEQGDSLYFEGDQPHVLENPSRTMAEYIVVIRY
jgi:quercetin dioxygenase-like cupin family protein